MGYSRKELESRALHSWRLCGLYTALSVVTLAIPAWVSRARYRGGSETGWDEYAAAFLPVAFFFAALISAYIAATNDSLLQRERTKDEGISQARLRIFQTSDLPGVMLRTPQH